MYDGFSQKLKTQHFVRSPHGFVRETKVILTDTTFDNTVHQGL